MMIKNECKIVRDLFPNYIENEVSNESKEFIDGHLKACKECSKILKDISKSNIKHEADEEKDEIDFLKKYNEKIKIAKTTIIILLIIIVSSFGTIAGTYAIKYCMGKRAHDIISEAYSRIEELKKQNNFTLEVDYGTSKTTLSFKDGYFKEKNEYSSYFKNELEACGDIIYGKPENLNEPNYWKSSYIGVRWNYDINNNLIAGSLSVGGGDNILLDFNGINKIYNKKILECINIKVIENEEWYILKEYSEKSGINEFYISKNDMLLKKLITNDTYITTYKYTIGTLTDEDVKLTDIDENLLTSNFAKNVWNDYLKE